MRMGYKALFLGFLSGTTLLPTMVLTVQGNAAEAVISAVVCFACFMVGAKNADKLP